jgi:hypothetical protein
MHRHRRNLANQIQGESMMIGRKAIVGLSVLSALFVCAFAAQGASAAEAQNTTAYTCVAKTGGDFFDAHCDEPAPGGTGKFTHEEFALNVETEVHITNEKTKNGTKESTPAVLTGTLAGAPLEITCTVVGTDTKNKSFVRNTEPLTKTHQVDGTAAVIFENCTVNKPAKCTVPSITVSSFFKGVEKEGPEKNTMGLEFSPDPKGSSFVTITLEGPECAVKGIAFKVEGTAVATGTPNPKEKYSGATTVFTNEMTKGVGCEKPPPTSGLCIGGKPADFSAVLTTSMVKENKTENPISLTTPT